MIDLKELRKIASQGLPDDAGIRSIVWKVTAFAYFQSSLLEKCWMLFFTGMCSLGIIIVTVRLVMQSTLIC